MNEVPAPLLQETNEVIWRSSWVVKATSLCSYRDATCYESSLTFYHQNDQNTTCRLQMFVLHVAEGWELAFFLMGSVLK